MRPELAIAGQRCERGELALAAADIGRAIADGSSARRLLQTFGEFPCAATFVRAAVLELDGLALADRLREAEDVAIAACVHAALFCHGSRWEALADLRLNEVREMRHAYSGAARGFADLEAALQDEPWAYPIRLRCCNHLISIGVHNCDPVIAETGVRRGERIRAFVKEPDEVAAWLQWRGIYESRRARTEASIRTLRESFLLRAPTERRAITRGFLEAEIAYAERGESAGVAVLEHTLEKARLAGMLRHARAGAEHMIRLRPR